MTANPGLSAVKTAGRQTVETGKALAAARSPEAFVAANASGVRAALELVALLYPGVGVGGSNSPQPEFPL